jgi:hypothetical protein
LSAWAVFWAPDATPRCILSLWAVFWAPDATRFGTILDQIWDHFGANTNFPIVKPHIPKSICSFLHILVAFLARDPIFCFWNLYCAWGFPNSVFEVRSKAKQFDRHWPLQRNIYRTDNPSIRESAKPNN